MPTKRQRRKKRRRQTPATSGAPVGSAEPSTVVVDDAQRTKAAARRSAPGKAPQALWGSFPLSELVVLLALILLVAGFFIAGQRGGVMMIVGIALGALAGVELAAREHFAGYRSHSLLLGAVAGMLTFVLLIVLGLSPVICTAVAVAVLGGSAWLLVQAFRRRTGGAAYKIKAG